jgi:xanthine/CO dehydrogenase XdhC/CoxF family maturation factor
MAIYRHRIRNGGETFMTGEKREVVPGLTAADAREMADKVFDWTEGNHPQANNAENGFLNILQDEKPDVLAKYKALGRGYTGIMADVLNYVADNPEILSKVH